MPIGDLKGQIARVPEQPGVYLYYNGHGDTLYVGKASVLRDRVRSYLGARGTSPRIDALLDEAQRLEVIVTDSVVEALALENNLIKQRAPKYNILLRDDKTYPYLQLTTGEAYPRVLVARRVERDDHFYAGPFMPASLARRTMSLTHKLFGLRSCNEAITGDRPRPCLEFDIKRCVAPCVHELCSEDEYRVAVEHTKLFLEGRNDELLLTLRDRMTEAAHTEQFERAAQIRDAIKTIETLRARQQKMASPELGDRDAFGLKAGPAGAVVQVFQMRRGRVVERIELVTDSGALDARPGPSVGGAGGVLPGPGCAAAAPAGLTDCDVLQAAIQQFYAERTAAPEVHIPMPLARTDADVIEGWLSGEAGRRVRLIVPKRGEKRGLLDLASRNAEVAYQARFNENVAANYDALETLRVVLGLRAAPRRIECFDISTIQGSETVASMVVCEDGRMKRAEYRKFRIRGNALARPGGRLEAAGDAADIHSPAALQQLAADAPDARTPARGSRFLNDFAAMHEVVLRRYRKLLEAGGPFPDLILIDGGKGQLSSAYSALQELGLGNLVAAGLAKKEELLFTRDLEDAIALPRDSPSLLLIQRIRDEAHRFAVTFHRLSRTKRDLQSELDAIGGIGPRRRKALLTAFGSLAGVRRATREELMTIVGAKCADTVLAHFAARG
ncbi:MAG: excinuclease ABC subunit UvrC [Acidobacteriota bacterium]|nr:excinuclease ABC subunit UvrC [Acidobacteriota bacterium]